MVDWPVAQSVLANGAAYARSDATVPPSSLLPPAERRRATPATRIALTVAQQALAQAQLNAVDVSAVFASSSGNPDIIHDICAMLAARDYQISPIKFHNSVHNAASGYYSIAVQSHRAVTSLCAFDGTAPAALLESAAQANADNGPVLMVSYDLPYPFPLSEARPMVDAWAIALAVAPAGYPDAIAQIVLSADSGVPDTELSDPALNAARIGNPTARLLPLLAALARSKGEVVLRQGNGRPLRVQVR